MFPMKMIDWLEPSYFVQYLKLVVLFCFFVVFELARIKQMWNWSRWIVNNWIGNEMYRQVTGDYVYVIDESGKFYLDLSNSKTHS